MIRVTPIANAAAAKAYFSAPDYYLEGQEEPAHWHGKAAERLGLSGAVNYPDFEKLCDNQHPKSGDQLTAKHIANRRVGYDWTFSPSKSVSLAYIAGDTRIADEFRGAVEDTMAEVEREMQTRMRKGGAFENRTTGNMIWTDFLHKTSRPIKGVPDPQLHVHAVVLNATYDPVERQWKAGEFGALKANAPYFQAVFRAHLANRLQNLGYELTRTKDDFEITGVSPETVKRFSRRTTLIEKVAGKLQKNLEAINPNLKLSVEAKAKIGAGSREAKSDAFTWDQLVKVWTSQLKTEELDALTPNAEPVKPQDRCAESVTWALSHLLERSSVVSQRQVITEALKHGLGNVTVEGVAAELARPGLIRRNMDGVDMVSTQGVLNEEKRIVAFAQKGRGRFRPLSSGEKLAPAANAEISTLSPSQSSAVKHALQSRDRLILIRGAAGTGKTTMTRSLLEQVNVPWVILAPSAEASRGVLRRDGFQDAETLAKFLLDAPTQEKARNGLIVLDEASLAGAHDMHRLVDTADYLNARILLLGDRRQHKSVARGDVLALLEDRAGLPVAEVSEIKRQSGEYKAAVALASKGNVSGAIQKLDKLGWVQEAEHGLTEKVADEYVAATKAGKSVLVVSPTHAEGDKVTTAIRERLKKEGKLDGTEQRAAALEAANLTQAQREDPETLKACAGQTACFVRHGIVPAGQRVTITEENAEALAKQGSRFVVYKPRDLDLAKGDLLRVTSGIKDTDGKRIDNGAMLTYLGTTDTGKLRVETASGTNRLLPADVSHITHGYVTTSHAAQGRTVQRVLIHAPTATFGAVDKASGYVAISRGKEKATIFTDDKVELLAAVSRERPRLLALELVRRPRHRVRDRLKRHVSFLRELGTRLMDHAVDRGMQKKREKVYERE
jgi:conjugative relaxase-like TrwC/TraI family protein